jgi:hypothetical protein
MQVGRDEAQNIAPLAYTAKDTLAARRWRPRVGGVPSLPGAGDGDSDWAMVMHITNLDCVCA